MKKALMIRVKRKFNYVDLVDASTDLLILRGQPEYIRSDNGAEFIVKRCAHGSGWVAQRLRSSR
jgi:hypothetical protein